jgi:hypothetical protein
MLLSSLCCGFCLLPAFGNELVFCADAGVVGLGSASGKLQPGGGFVYNEMLPNSTKVVKVLASLGCTGDDVVVMELASWAVELHGWLL